APHRLGAGMTRGLVGMEPKIYQFSRLFEPIWAPDLDQVLKDVAIACLCKRKETEELIQQKE
ncbi:hypothetical protein ACQP3D_27485, partial [Escherichia coli]